MEGTKAGGKKCAMNNKELHGDDYYSKLGKMGGAVSHPKTRWFSLHPELASKYGKKRWKNK